MRKKILFYTMALIKGGTEKTIWNLSNHFIDQYDITIVCNINHPEEFSFDSRIKIIKIDSTDRIHEKIPKKIITKLGPSRSRKLINIIEEEKPNLMIGFLPEPTIRLLKLKKRFPNIPIITAIRNHPKNEFHTLIEKMIRNYYYSFSDCILLQDDHFKKYLPEKLYSKIKIIPNYISSSFINLNNHYSFGNKIVSVARLERQKNIPLLIRAFSKLDSKYTLSIYGNGSLKKKLKQMIIKYQLQDRVFLCGNEDKIEEKIKDAALFVSTSNYEGMPNSILEAMALSLPVITTNSSDALSTFIHPYKDGIIVPKKNETALLSQMNYLLNHKDIAKKMGENASYVKKNYHKDNIIHLWQEVIEETNS